MKLVPVDTLTIHPEAGRVPLMAADQWEAFVADVKERKVRVPLEVEPGTKVVLDGRSRLLAAKEANLSSVPVVDAPLNGDDPVQYMFRAASIRRHFTDDQRAMMAQEETEYLAKKNRSRQASEAGKASARRKRKGNVEADAASTLPNAPKPRARKQAAKGHKVSERKVKQAQKVKKANPKLAAKVKAGEVKLATAVREVDREAKRRKLQAKANQASETNSDSSAWQIIHGDCLRELSGIKAESIALLFADPPYNIGIDYGEGAKADSLPDVDYLCWAERWVSLCHDCLIPAGTLWLLIGDEYAAEYAVILKKTGFTLRAWIKWYETFGVNCANNFNRCSRHLFYCVKDSKHFTFHRDAVCRPSDRQTKYNDSRADPGGKIWDDVWQIPRLVGTATERIPDFPTQLPLALLRPIIGATSNPGELVVDPFCGSATTGVAAVELGRRFIGIDKSGEFCRLATLRMKGMDR